MCWGFFVIWVNQPLKQNDMLSLTVNDPNEVLIMDKPENA